MQDKSKRVDLNPPYLVLSTLSRFPYSPVGYEISGSSAAGFVFVVLLTSVSFMVFSAEGILEEIGHSLEPNEMNAKQIISSSKLSED